MLNQEHDDVVILGGARTPIGAFMGALSSLTAPQLGRYAIDAALSRVGLSGDEVEEVIMGCVLTAGLGQAPARQASLGAAIPNHVPCMTINKVCGSGMKAAMLAGQSIFLGESSVVVAGGMESMSNSPYLLQKARTGYRMGNGTLLDSMVGDSLWDPYGNCHMGTCADETSVEENFTREELDAFAAESYRRALEAQERGRFADEIVEINVPQRKGEPLVVAGDEEPGKGDVIKLSKLRGAFSPEGRTTAGNASSINDGACALVLSSSTVARTKDLQPLAKLVAWSSFAQEPRRFTTAPSGAIQKLLEKTNLTVDDIDLFEVNEAFSVVALSVAKKLRISPEKLNVNGGAVALGHPIGMTGARLILTLALELKRRGARYGIATPCIGGGEATAVLIENLAI